ncbi:MAG: BspA family leucine-rich repeat surface protein [Ekhidna sp.]
MKKFYFTISFMVMLAFQGMAQSPFITSWSVTDGDEITIPVNNSLTYDFSYVWKDDTGAEIASAIEVTGDIVQPFSLTGTVTLEITGAFPHFQGYPKDQLLDVRQWGDIVWGSMSASFQDWTGTGFSATDVPDLSQVKNMSVMFRDADNFNQDLNSWDVSNITNMQALFRQADLFNGDVSNWNVENVTNMERVFESTLAFNQDISGWDVRQATSMRNMLNASNLSTANYDKILISWSALEGLQENVSFGASDITFCIATEAKNILEGLGWTITDAGQSCEEFTRILSFSLEEQVGETTIDSDDFTVAATVLLGTDLTALSPAIELAAGAISSPADGEEVDFSSGAVTYTVTYQVDGAETTVVQDWEVTVSAQAQANDETDILSFALEEQISTPEIDKENHTIRAEVAFDAPIESLVPMITVSELATISPVSGDAVDFSESETSPVVYTVTAQDGITVQDWEVTVVVEPVETDILSFSVPGQVGVSTIDTDNHTVDLLVTENTDVTSLVPTLTVSEGATISPESGVEQDFTNEVIYTVVAENGITEQDWTINVNLSDQRPFITSWSTTIDEETISIALNGGFTYDFNYVWKDELANEVTSGTHTTSDGSFDTELPTTGNYTLEITGTYPHFRNYPKDQLLDVQQWGDIVWGSFGESFRDWPGESFSAPDSPNLTDVTSMQNMFRGASNFDADLSSWNVSNVTSMRSMFQSASNFDADLGSWDVGNVTDMIEMFRSASSFNADLSRWNTSNAQLMGFMFSGAVSFTSDISSWDVSSVTTMTSMFNGASSFNSGLSSWNVSNVTLMRDMFRGATNFNDDLSTWDVSKVTRMDNMFNGTSLTSQNYDKILIGWAALPSLQEGVSLGAGGITFCKAAAARSVLSNDFGWSITDADESCSDETDILSFVLTNQTGDAVINTDDHTISIEVLFTNVLDTLTSIITLSPGATIDPASGEEVDFTSPVTYIVTAEDGTTTQDWIISVSVAPPSEETDILSFEFAEQTGAAVINTVDNTIAIEVGFGTNVSALVPTFILSLGATSNPVSGEEADFSDAVVYTITAQDGIATQEWTVEVAVAPNMETNILTFELSEQTGATLINVVDHTIAIEVEFGTDVTALAPTITLSEGATSNPASGVAQDFTSPVTYVVTAEDGVTTQDWAVMVTIDSEEPDTDTDILTFTLAEQTDAAMINIIDHEVTIEVAFGTDVSALTPTFTLSEGATSNPASGVAQDFTSPVTYVVTAEDDVTTQDWTVMVTVDSEELDTDTDILTFILAERTEDAAINTTDHTVAIEVEFGTEVSSLVPTITLSEGATSNPASRVAQDFTSPVTYVVTAEDGTTSQEWTVTVTIGSEDLDTDTDILTFILAERTGDAVINTTDHTVAIEVEFGTEVSSLVPTITLSEGATSNPASGVAQDFTNPVTYVVMAEDGVTTQDWTVTVTIDSEEPDTDTDILTFILAERAEDAAINTIDHTVAIEVEFGTEVSSLIPTITLSEGATSNPVSGVAQDFTDPVTYVVTAEDGVTTQDWTVTVTVVDSPLGLDNEIDLRIYPNPVSDVLQVKTKEEVSISLTDLNGRVIIGEKQGSLFQMDLSQLRNGTYLLMIKSDGQVSSHRIIKTN